MATAGAIIASALQRLGVLAAGQQAQSEDAQLCLGALNSIVDSWGLQSLLSTNIGTTVYPVPSGATAVTIGPGGDIEASTVPVRIPDGAFMRTSGTDYPIEIVDRVTYQDIGDKSITANTPDVMFYDRGPTVGTLHLYPGMSGTGELHLPIGEPAPNFADLTTDYTLPQGYEQALIYTLAEDAQESYGRALPPTFLQRGAMLRRNLRRASVYVPQLDVAAPARFNILSGDWR